MSELAGPEGPAKQSVARTRAVVNGAVRRLAAPTAAQRAYLRGGLDQPGGKLPMFDRKGAAVPATLIRACIDHGWAERWFANPLAPDWLVCRLTPRGAKAVQRQD